uniref:Actin-related protein 2 isoform X2 n=1 Tax=Rhizophora mucronata TaxID=61149 RepID=A0A2P2MCL6_RHIMU
MKYTNVPNDVVKTPLNTARL